MNLSNLQNMPFVGSLFRISASPFGYTARNLITGLRLRDPNGGTCNHRTKGSPWLSLSLKQRRAIRRAERQRRHFHQRLARTA